jgi:hypothetical protein
VEYLKYVGAEINTISETETEFGPDLYKGFIYSFCITSTGIVDPVSEIAGAPNCGDGYCTNCPTGPVCLENCDWLYYLSDTGTCEQCEDFCPEGCSSPDGCS